VGTPLTRNEILLGAKLGPYEIVRFLGQGGTASVFEGRHALLRKLVAIKILHEHLANDASVASRFVQEGKITAQLRHPHAIDVLDVGEERGVAYLVMELLDGTNLGARLGDGSATTGSWRSTTRSRSCSRWPRLSRTRTVTGSFIAT
jgi:serine/threonine-protein kinase